MMMASETARLNEPSTMTPMYRAQQNQAHDLVSYAQTIATDPTFDYEKDIKPLRQAFFGGLATSGLPDNQQDMLTSRYAPEFDSIEDRAVKDRSNLQSIRNSDLAFQNAQLQLAEARKKIQREREAEEMMPEMADRLDNILSSDQPAAKKYQGVASFINSNPNFFTSPAGSKLANNALSSIPQTSQLQAREDTLDPTVKLAVDAALNSNSVSGMEKIIQDHKLPADVADSLIASVKDRAATIEGEQNKAYQRAVYDTFSAVRKEANSVIEDTSATVAKVNQVQQQLGDVLNTLGASSESYNKLKQAVDAEIAAAGASTSKTGSTLRELAVEKASNELKALLSATVIEVNNIMLKSLQTGTSFSSGGRGREIDPSRKRPGVDAISQIAKPQ
tara:strand:- start:648 stop:1817 length:1170 start_codon:yes stop_codon:yes gene_type:complete